MVVASKPSIEKMVTYLKSAIPNCSISKDELEAFQPVYANATVKDLNRVFHQAIRNHTMQPVFFMTQQLNIIRPSADPFNSSATQTHDWRGRPVENGTNWNAIYSQIDQRMSIAKKNYDARHGQGAWERDNKALGKLIHDDFVNMEKGKPIPKKNAVKCEKLRQSLGFTAYEI